jgi:hypothetical protein
VGGVVALGACRPATSAPAEQQVVEPEPTKSEEAIMSNTADAEGILRVQRGTRVRFPYVTPTKDSDGPTFKVVRVLTKAGEPVRPDGDKVLVALRHSRRWRDALATIAVAGDRPLSWVVGRLIVENQSTKLDDFLLPMDILADRGRPSTDTERTLNLVIERDAETPNSWTTDSVGEYVDQAYYLTNGEIEKLERLTKAQPRELSPGQVVDGLVMQELAKVSQQLSR